MKKSKILLPVFLILSLVIIISAVVVSLTSGINLGIDFVGGKQVEVKIEATANKHELEEKTNNVLAKYNLSINSCFVEDKFTDTYFVVKVNTKEITEENALALRTDLATELGVSLDDVSSILDISGNVKQKTVITVGIIALGIFVALFLAGWLKYGVMEALGILFGTIHNMIISLAVIVLTRIELTVQTCASLVIYSMLFMGLFGLILEKSHREISSNRNKELTPSAIYKSELKSNIVIPFAFVLALVFGISTLFTGSNVITFFALGSIICTCVAAYSLLITTHLTGYLADAKEQKDREKLSKNN